MDATNPPVTFNANDLIPRFWSVVQKELASSVEKGELETLDYGVYRGTPQQVASFQNALDKALGQFSKIL